MTVLLVGAGAVMGGFVLLLRALLVDEARGRLRRRIAASVDATIASLPPELQEEWGEEWRAEMVALMSMPLVALMYARNLRSSARELVAERGLALVAATAPTQSRWAGLRARWPRTRNALRGFGSRVRAALASLAVVRSAIERAHMLVVVIASSLTGALITAIAAIRVVRIASIGAAVLITAIVVARGRRA